MRIEYDPETDILTIEGVKYSGELFRRLGGIGPGQPDEVMRVMSRNDGVLVLQVVQDEALRELFDGLAMGANL